MNLKAERIRKRKQEGLGKKRWNDDEVVLLLNYMLENQDIEKPTAQIYYKKFLASTNIDTTWDLVRWKVKNLKTSYWKAEDFRISTGYELHKENEGISSLEKKLLKICRFYNELYKIFGPKNPQSSSTTANLPFEPSFIINEVNDQSEFECSEYLNVKTEPEASKDDFTEVQPSSSNSQTSFPPSMLKSPPCKTQYENGDLNDFASKLKRIAPKDSFDKLLLIHTERNKLSKLKIDFEQKKFEKEIRLKEREIEFKEKQLEEQIKERKENAEIRKLEIERDVRLRILELEKKERLEQLEIEMRYKFLQK